MSVQPPCDGQNCPPYELFTEHCGDKVTAVVVMRSVGERFAAGQAVGDSIVAEDVRGFDRVRHWLDAVGMDFGQLIDVADDLGELVCHFRKLAFGELQPSEKGDFFDIRAREAHIEESQLPF